MWRFLGMALLVAILVTTGCSDTPSDQPELGIVRGTVTIDGNPLAGVDVYFKPDEGRLSIGRVDDMGNYMAMYKIDLEGVKVGPNTVTVEWGTDGSAPYIPPEYGANSTLKLDVKPGDNVFNIDMMTPDAPPPKLPSPS